MKKKRIILAIIVLVVIIGGAAVSMRYPCARAGIPRLRAGAPFAAAAATFEHSPHMWLPGGHTIAYRAVADANLPILA